LVAVFSVNKEYATKCECRKSERGGRLCGKVIYARVCLVEHEDGTIECWGRGCTAGMVGGEKRLDSMPADFPHVQGRRLTPEEIEALRANGQALIAMFRAERESRDAEVAAERTKADIRRARICEACAAAEVRPMDREDQRLQCWAEEQAAGSLPRSVFEGCQLASDVATPAPNVPGLKATRTHAKAIRTPVACVSTTVDGPLWTQAEAAVEARWRADEADYTAPGFQGIIRKEVRDEYARLMGTTAGPEARHNPPPPG